MNDVLSNFYKNLLPAFQPRTESFLHRATRADLQHTNFRYIFSVKGMIEISRVIEDAVIASPGVSDTHVSFQYFSRIAPQLWQYTRVAEASTGLWLYGIPDAPVPSLPRTVAVSTSATPLEKYWFVVAYGPGMNMTLLAEEIAPEDGQRLYEGFYTFEPETTYQIIMLMHQMFPIQIPEPVSPESIGS